MKIKRMSFVMELQLEVIQVKKLKTGTVYDNKESHFSALDYESDEFTVDAARSNNVCLLL